MFGQVIRTLIYVCLMALAFYLCVWVLGIIGLPIPQFAVMILGVIFVLVCILILYRLWAPWIGGVNWWGSPPP